PGFAGLGVHPPPPARTGLGPPCCRAVVRPVAASPWWAACRSLWAALGAVALGGRLSLLRAVRARLAPLARCSRAVRFSLAPGRRLLARPTGKRSVPVGRSACRARAVPASVGNSRHPLK